MKPRTILLFVGSLLMAVCVCVAAFLALGAFTSNDPETMARINATQTAEALAATSATQAADVEPTLIAGASLILDETFDSNNLGLNLYEETSIQTSLQDGTYHAYFGSSGLESTVIAQNLTNFVVEMDCKTFGNRAVCGFAFGVQPHDENTTGAAYHVYTVGDSYRFDSIRVDVASSSFENFTLAHKSGDWNHFRLEAVNGLARLYLNGEFVDDFELKEPSLATGDLALDVGLASNAENADSGDITIDNLKVWEVSQ